MEIGKLYSIKIKDRKQRTIGVFIEEGKEWVLLIDLYADYLLDGYILVNKEYIENIERSEKDVFTEEVLIANDKINIPEYQKLPLITENLLKWFYDNQTVIQVENRDGTMSWIGKILGGTEKSIYLDNLDPKGIWTSTHFTFRKNAIRLISFDTDYIKSLVNYNKRLQDESLQENLKN